MQHQATGKLVGDRDNTIVGGVLTTEHPASSYGLPVFVADWTLFRRPGWVEPAAVLGPAEITDLCLAPDIDMMFDAPDVAGKIRLAAQRAGYRFRPRATIYTVPAIRQQRKALVLSLIDDGSDQALAIAESICGRLGERPYDVSDGEQTYERGQWYATPHQALADAESSIDLSAYGGDRETQWIDVRVTDALSGDTLSTTVTIEPAEPACARGHEHEWVSPHEVLGGLEDNPGVYGHGGGVMYSQVCAHCGAYRRVDTWAQRSDTGEQGLTSVRYDAADDRSERWVYRRRMTEARDRLDGESMVSRYTYDDAEGTIEVSLAGGGLFGQDVAARVRALLPEDEYMIRPVADDADTLTIIVRGI